MRVIIITTILRVYNPYNYSSFHFVFHYPKITLILLDRVSYFHLPGWEPFASGELQHP